LGADDEVRLDPTLTPSLQTFGPEAGASSDNYRDAYKRSVIVPTDDNIDN